MKPTLTTTQKAYLAELRKQLKNLEILGKKGTIEWWSIGESIDALKNNL